jgi:hypothetical protein
MIRRFEVSNFEFDELGAIVLPHAESDWENHHAKWVRRITWDNAVEGRFAWSQHVREIQTHLPQSAGEDEVETTPTIDEHLGEPDFCHHWIQDQGELTGLREAHPRSSWYRRLNGHDLPEKQLLVPPGAEVSIAPEDDIDDL